MGQCSRRLHCVCPIAQCVLLQNDKATSASLETSRDPRWSPERLPCRAGSGHGCHLSLAGTPCGSAPLGSTRATAAQRTGWTQLATMTTHSINSHRHSGSAPKHHRCCPNRASNPLSVSSTHRPSQQSLPRSTGAGKCRAGQMHGLVHGHKSRNHPARGRLTQAVSMGTGPTGSPPNGAKRSARCGRLA